MYKQKTYERDLYRYVVTHLNGEVSKAEGHVHERDEGFLLIREADDDTWAKITSMPETEIVSKPGWSGYRGFDVVKELEGVQEVEREKIGTDTWYFTIDKAKETIVDKTKERVLL